MIASTEASSTIALIGATVLTPLELIEDAVVVISEGRIRSVGPQSKTEIPPGVKRFSAHGKIVAPGYMDIHTHGISGHDLMSAGEEELDTICRLQAQSGTTSFLATTRPASPAVLLRTVERLGRFCGQSSQGARLLGIHLEGPFLNPERRGAFEVDKIRSPSIDEMKELINRSQGAIKVVTLAPEVEGALELISWLNERGVVVSVGHSNATYAITSEAISAGVRHTCHIFNAMRPFHHREPGVLGAVLTDDRVTTEVICDGIHLHPTALRLLLRCKGTQKVILVTDSSWASRLPEGRYEASDGTTVEVRDEALRLVDGTLAGSTLSISQAVRKAINLMGISASEAISMATLNAAELIGMSGEIGRVAEGLKADLIILEKDLTLYATIVEGRLVYQKDADS